MKSEKAKNLEAYTLAGIFEKNIKQVIKKRESFLPFYIKGFSDAHREYNKCVEQMFKVIKANEKKYFGKSDAEITKMCEKYIDMSFKAYLTQIDVSKEITSRYLDAHNSFMKSWNSNLKKISEEYQKQDFVPNREES